MIGGFKTIKPDDESSKSASEIIQPCQCPPCPKYDSIDTSKSIDSYNCAGLAQRTYTYMSLEDLKERLNKGQKIACSENCKPCNIKHWLWELIAWSLEFKLKNGVTIASLQAPSDFHTISGRTDCHGKDPSVVISKNGQRPLEGPGSISKFRLKTGDELTVNNASNKPLFLALASADIEIIKKAYPDIDVKELFYVGSEIDGFEMQKQKPTSELPLDAKYSKAFIKIDQEEQSCFCFPCS